jgi:ribosomal protein S18 acetylase RimI-like enzyme
MDDPLTVTVRPLANSEIVVVGALLGLARLNHGTGEYLVAWSGTEPVGHAYLTTGGEPHLQDVEVRVPYHRRGVARQLSAAAERVARDRGATGMELSVSVHNDAAQRLYRSLGFVDTGEPPRAVKGPVTIRTGIIEVDDELLRYRKRFDGRTP